MASSMEKELATHLECTICFGRFQDPKVLRCQHLYCKKCLERLVTSMDQGQQEVTCPECREKTEVPSGDVTNLPSNFLINNILSIRGDDHSNASSCCTKHDGEVLKLFCQTCDELICRDCIIDHRDHKYAFTKDIFPAEKENILKIVKESKVNMRALESSIETIRVQKGAVQKNAKNINRKIDTFITKQIEILERKGQSIRDDLQILFTDQEENIDTQMQSFVSSLACLKSSVEFAEQALSKGCEVEVLAAKKQLTELNLTSSGLKPRGRIRYSLETQSSLFFNNDTFEMMAKLREYDEEYEFGIIVDGELKSLESVNSYDDQLTEFCIRPRSNSTSFGHRVAQVKVVVPDSDVQFPVVTINPDGSFTFSYSPEKNFGDYKIGIRINGRCVQGSPFTWEVSMRRNCFKRRMLEKLN